MDDITYYIHYKEKSNQAGKKVNCKQQTEIKFVVLIFTVIRQNTMIINLLQGSKNKLICLPGRQLFHSDLPNGQGPRKVVCRLNEKNVKLRLVQGKQHLRACLKGELEFNFCLSPVVKIKQCLGFLTCMQLQLLPVALHVLLSSLCYTWCLP